MNKQIKQALEKDQTIDITTTGRKTGLPRRIEIWFYNLNGRLYISGLPGTRDWYANMVANSEFTFHLKRSVKADLLARARPIIDEVERRETFVKLFEKLGGERNFEEWMERSPLVEIEIDTE